MSYYNTGYQRATKLLVDKMVNGVLISTEEYDMTQQFLAYPSISDIEVARMNLEQYNARFDDFIAYIKQQHPLLMNVPITGERRKENSESCPVIRENSTPQ